jgi:hypothetical protein
MCQFQPVMRPGHTAAGGRGDSSLSAGGRRFRSGADADAACLEYARMADAMIWTAVSANAGSARIAALERAHGAARVHADPPVRRWLGRPRADKQAGVGACAGPRDGL